MTNGVVSVRLNGEVVVKLVTGCDGYNAVPLAAAIRALGRVPTYAECARLCREHGFGYGSSLVIQTPSRAVLVDADEDIVDDGHTFYHAKFSDPTFNPRWHYGTAEYVEVVDVRDGERAAGGNVNGGQS